MEHLYQPSDPSSKRYEGVPYVAEYYGDCPFLEFSSRSKFKKIYDLVVSLAADPEARNARFDKVQLETFVQTWLVFGILHEAFGHRARQDDFVRLGDDSKFRWLKTAELTNLVKWLMNKLKSGWHDDADFRKHKEDRAVHLMRCLDKAHEFPMLVSHRIGMYDAILWSTASICEALRSF